MAEIVAVEGVDGVFLGPNDLAASGGKRWPDVWNADEAYMDASARVAAVTRAAGKIAGILARDAAMARQVVGMGYRFVGGQQRHQLPDAAPRSAGRSDPRGAAAR